MQDNVLSFTSIHWLDSIVEELANNFELVERCPCFVTFVDDAYISITIPIKDDPSAPRLLSLLTGMDIVRSKSSVSKGRPDCADP